MLSGHLGRAAGGFRLDRAGHRLENIYDELARENMSRLPSTCLDNIINLASLQD